MLLRLVNQLRVVVVLVVWVPHVAHVRFTHLEHEEEPFEIVQRKVDLRLFLIIRDGHLALYRAKLRIGQ